jgi:hypothetical protein
MIEADSDHRRIVAESLAGKRQVDEQTFASLAVLGERLERLKERNEMFYGVAFSSAVERLQARRSAVMVG